MLLAVDDDAHGLSLALYARSLSGDVRVITRPPTAEDAEGHSIVVVADMAHDKYDPEVLERYKRMADEGKKVLVLDHHLVTDRLTGMLRSAGFKVRRMSDFFMNAEYRSAGSVEYKVGSALDMLEWLSRALGQKFSLDLSQPHTRIAILGILADHDTVGYCRLKRLLPPGELEQLLRESEAYSDIVKRTEVDVLFSSHTAESMLEMIGKLLEGGCCYRWLRSLVRKYVRYMLKRGKEGVVLLDGLTTINIARHIFKYRYQVAEHVLDELGARWAIFTTPKQDGTYSVHVVGDKWTNCSVSGKAWLAVKRVLKDMSDVEYYYGHLGMVVLVTKRINLEKDVFDRLVELVRSGEEDHGEVPALANTVFLS